MPFWKKMFNKRQGVYYPRAVVQGKPVETETIAKDLAITGLGYFRYTLDTVGVDSLEAFDFEKQVKAVRVEFIPERTRLANGTYTRALVDNDQLEWIELSPDTKDNDPAQDDDGEGVTENPLG